MNKVLLVIITLLIKFNAISQPIETYKLFAYKQERTGGASMNYDDGRTAMNVTTDYLLFVDSKKNLKPLIKRVYVNGLVASFTIVPIKKLPNFGIATTTQKSKKSNTKNKSWQIVIDILELPKTKHPYATLTQKNELVIVLKNNQKLVLKKILNVDSKIYE